MGWNRKMAKKTNAEIEKLFTPYLHEGEAIRWIGAPKRNGWHLKLETFLMIFLWLTRLIHLMLYSLRWIFLLIWAGSGILLLSYSILHTLYLVFSYPGGKGAVLIIFFHIEFWIGSFLLWIAKGFFKIFTGLNPIGKPSLSKLPYFWESMYFAITNQRTLIFEQGSIHEYSLLLLADAIVAKPKHEASTIYLYDKTNPTGELPEPIFQLRGIVEEDAQTAYEILRQAREEALEDRAREMGIG
jgi:hypothetical protein